MPVDDYIFLCGIQLLKILGHVLLFNMQIQAVYNVRYIRPNMFSIAINNIMWCVWWKRVKVKWPRHPNWLHSSIPIKTTIRWVLL